MLKHQIVKTTKGLTVVKIPMSSVESVTVLAFANTGSRYETPELQGIAHFFEHMVFKGTANYATSQILAAAVDGVGADFNAFTSKEYTGYYVHSAAQHVALALDVVSDMLLTPKLQQADIDREKGVIIEELNMYVDSPQRHIDNVFENLLFGADPGLAHDIVGTKQTIQSFTSADFSRFLNHWYGLNNLVLVVAGDERVVNSKTLMEQIETAFGKAPQSERGTTAKEAREKSLAPKVFGDERLSVVYRKTEQAHFILGWPGIHRLDPRRYALSLLSTILGGNMSSRLFTEVREQRGLCYYVHSSDDYFQDVGVFGAAAGVDPKRAAEALKVTVGEFLDIASGKRLITELELQRAKDYVVGKTVLGLEDSESVAQYFGIKQLLRGEIETPDEVLAKVKAVKLDDLHQIAQQLIIKDQLRLAIIGPFKNQAKVQQWLDDALAQKPVKSASKKSSKK
jgi:predicted Zn-dependent peptidase